MVAPLGGTWREGWIEGVTREGRRERWTGYAGFVPIPGRAVWLLESDALPEARPRLDAFEGDGFHRVVVTFWLPDGSTLPSCLYVVREDG